MHVVANNGQILEGERFVSHRVQNVRTAPSLVPADESSEHTVRAWLDLMKSADRFLLGGLAARGGVDQMTRAYRQWCAERCGHREHIERLSRRLQDIGE
jgi:hypothetical protein